MAKLNTEKLVKNIEKYYRQEKKDWKSFAKRNEKRSKPWTKSTKSIFKKIGEEEFDLDIWQSKIKNKKEFMALDQVWFDKNNNEPIVGIESENSAKFNEIKDDEFRKLLNFKSDYKILIWYCQPNQMKKDWEKGGKECYGEDWKKVNDWKFYDGKYIKELEKLVKEHSKTDGETFIIISMLWDDDVEKTEWRINIIKKDNDTKIKEFDLK